MARPQTRDFESADKARMDAVFAELRAHFHEWSNNYESEHHLIGFAYYEGCGGSLCCGSILSKAAPLAVGKELVTANGFQWKMLRAEGGWHYAVVHPSLGLFVALESLDDGSWLDADHFDPSQPGKRAHDSYDAIIKYVESEM